MSDIENEYPKMVYPDGASTSLGAIGSGVIAHNEDEEKELMKNAPKDEKPKKDEPAEKAKPAAGTPGWTAGS